MFWPENNSDQINDHKIVKSLPFKVPNISLTCMKKKPYDYNIVEQCY